jgi:hypothetical protein
MGGRSFLVALLLAPASLGAAAPRPPTGPQPRWGRLANPGWNNQRIKTALFFAGQARDGSARYGGVKAVANLNLYTVHPRDGRHLNWSARPANRAFALKAMADAGLNVVTMSTWGESFLPAKVGWPAEAPMQVAPQATDELYEAAAGRRLLIMPLIESRRDWAFRDEFPRRADGRIAPGTVSQIKDLIRRHLKNPKHPEWAKRWARVYDRRGVPRYAVVIIHASSARLGPDDHKAFAAGFDLLARQVFREARVNVGFFLDVLPPLPNAPGRFKANPQETGPELRKADAVLGIQCFLPEVWWGKGAEAGRITWKRDFSRGWFNSGVPFLVDVSPGYDNHLVFPRTRLQYGFTPAWREALTRLAADYGRNGVVYNSWNGYTEGVAAVPTTEHKDCYYRWLQTLNAGGDREAGKRRRGKSRLHP